MLAKTWTGKAGSTPMARAVSQSSSAANPVDTGSTETAALAYENPPTNALPTMTMVATTPASRNFLGISYLLRYPGPFIAVKEVRLVGLNIWVMSNRSFGLFWNRILRWRMSNLSPSSVRLLVVIALIAALLACNSTEPTADLSDIAVDDIVTTPDDGQAVSAAGSDTTTSGGTLRVILGCSDSLDPAVGDCHELYDEVYARLTSISGDPADPIQLDLAESYSVDDGGTTYTFVLRRDLKFSDGSPLTAQDIKWSWERALSPDTGSEAALDVLGGIVGAAQVAAGETDSINGVRFVDDRTLIVQLTAPSPLFPYQVADHIAAPLNRRNVENWQVDFASDSASASRQNAESLPVGTGPFRVAEYGLDSGNGIRIESNPHYHLSPPLLDEVQFVPLEISGQSAGQFDAAAAMLTMFEAGEIDISPFASRDTQTADGTNLERMLADGVAFLAFNTATAPLDDIHVRRAIVAASNVSESQGTVAAYSLLWDGLPGYDPDVAVDRYDLAAASDEVDLSEHSDLKSFNPLTLCHWNNLGGGLSIQADLTDFAESWAQAIGIEVVESESTSDECPQDADIVSVYIEPRFPDPHAVLAPVATLFGDEAGDYDRVAELINAAASTADTVSRLSRYSEIERYLHDQALVLPIFWNRTIITEHIRNTVRGYNPKLYGGSTYSSVWLDQSAR